MQTFQNQKNAFLEKKRVRMKNKIPIHIYDIPGDGILYSLSKRGYEILQILSLILNNFIENVFPP